MTSSSIEPHIVIVDDDPELRRMVAQLLRTESYRATPVSGGSELFAVLENGTADLIILDVMLRGQSGLDLCQRVRRTSHVPIMMLTSKGEEADRVIGLELGADDYLTKPFGGRELLARVKALLRRSSLQATSEPRARLSGYHFSGWTLDVLKRELVSPSGALVDLTTGEYSLLLALVESGQRALSREQLLDVAQNRSTAPGFDRSIDVQISRLRKKLGSDDAEDMIKTIRGVGYMFVPNVAKR